ncbi:conjugal transfer protein (plasmid) [Streptomyces sp. NBC_01023]|uniref:hypothetical protein n=1 Tax=Streptomyces sp. NBC_01023 TaxID=2903724 RepID=UPI002F916B34|nr:conjugal transfer protein [Streptomyces sp. NBC_01023]
MSTATAGGADSEVLVGRCYTKARRHPLMIGRMPGGRGRLWGGPYTVPQVIVLVVSFLLLILTRPLWAHFGLVDVLIALGVPFGLSLLVRHIHIDGRNPLAVAASAVGMLATPHGGRMGGRPLSSPGHRRLIGACTLTWDPQRTEEEAPGPVASWAPRARAPRVIAAAAPMVPAPNTARTAARPPGQQRVQSRASALLAARPIDDSPRRPLSESSTDEGVMPR